MATHATSTALASPGVGQTTLALTASGSTGNAAVFVPEVWADGTLEAIEYAMVMQKRVNTDFQGDISKAGDVVHVQGISNLSSTAKISNTDIVFEAVTEEDQTVVITEHYYSAFLIESIVDIQAHVDLRSKYQKKLGYALSRRREAFLTNLIASLTGLPAVGTYGVELTYDDYLQVWTTLATAGLLESSVTVGDDFTMMLSPQAWASTLKVDEFINADYNGDNGSAIQQAEVGRVFGLRAFMSNLLNVSGTGHVCGVFSRDAITFAVQKDIKIESDHLIWKDGDAVVASNIYGGKAMLFPLETSANAAYAANRGLILQTV